MILMIIVIISHDNYEDCEDNLDHDGFEQDGRRMKTKRMILFNVMHIFVLYFFHTECLSVNFVCHGPLTRYVKLRVAHAQCREHFPRHRLQRNH